MIVLLNLAVASAGGWVSMCRMTKMRGSETKLAIRWQYSLWFVGFATSGWSFLLADPASPVQLFLTSVMLAALCMGIDVWRHGAPHYTRRVA